MHLTQVCATCSVCYGRLSTNAYGVLTGRDEPASELMPHVHHVAISHEHLDYYLDEFTFRYNRRTSRSRGKLFYRLVQQAVQADPVPYAAMVKHVRENRINHTRCSGP